jgi:hypothetical protein
MKKRGGLVFVFLLVFSLCFVVADVKINEIELNPSGSDSGNEWTEIFNDGEQLNLSGWYLQNKGGKNFSIPNITLDNFYVLDGLTGLVNSNETIELYNELNILIDFTGNLSDGSNDQKTWQRIPDGTGEFFLREQTKENVNNYLNITNLSNYPLCVISGNGLELKANVKGYCISEVIFSVENDGDFQNFSGQNLGLGDYKASLENLSNGDFSWKVYAKDCFDNLIESEEENFYVNMRTQLIVNPSEPDGLNGFYVNEPIFSLDNSDAVSLFYQWDAGMILNYTGEFDLNETPNNWQETGGVVNLKFWSEFGCGVEDVQEKWFNFDFKNPVFKEISPQNGSEFFSLVPEIYVLIEDIYGSNSGINLSSINLELDGFEVIPDINILSNSKVEVEYNPFIILDEGIHEAKVYVQDLAGRESELSWYFEVNLSQLGEFEINSPVSENYVDKRILFYIDAGQEVDEITYKDLSESNPRERVLCRRCEVYERWKSLKDGSHNIQFRLRKDGLIVGEKEVLFFVDSKKPQINRMRPLRRLSNGVFNLEFKEENPLEVNLFYGEKNKSVIISEECELNRGKYFCEVNAEVEEYDGEEIEYWFEVKDIVDNSVVSRKGFVEIDSSAPILNNPGTFWTKGTGRYRDYVYFNLNVDEKNFDKVVMKYEYNGRERKVRICNRLQYGNCEKRFKLREGYRNFNVIISDKVGNVLEIPVEFN